nr:hypothetical protein [Tanacetum cinerariifolium]
MCEMACQIIQKKQEEKRIEEEQAANARYWKIPACCDDADDYNSVITPNEPVDSLSMRDEHLNTVSTTESDEFIKSSVENLVPNPSESEGENGCDVPACFTTFSNVLFDADYDFDSVNDQSCSDEDVTEKIFLNPLFEEEIIFMRIDPHHFNAESNLIESLLNHDSSIIPSSLMIDSLLDEFAGELTLLKSIPPGVDEIDCYPENEIRFSKSLLYDNSSPRLSKEFVFDNSDTEIESFSPSSIPIKDSDSFIEEIDLTFTLDDPMPPGIKEDDDDSERDIIIRKELLDNHSLSLLKNESFRFDIPSFSRPPTKPPDGNTRILNIKMMGDNSEQTVPIPGLTITRVSNQEKSPDLLSHRGFETFQPFTECPMMIHGKNIPILDVPLFHFYPLDQLKYGGERKPRKGQNLIKTGQNGKQCPAVGGYTQETAYATTVNYNSGDQVLTGSTNNVPPLVVQPSPASTSFSTISSFQMPEVTKDTVQPSTENIQPLVAQTEILIYEPVVAPKPKPTIPYPLTVNKQKLHEKDDNPALKFVKTSKNLHFELSFIDALLHMPKFALMFKSLLNNKDKLFDLAINSVNENCSVVILKKLLKKLGDPDKFLIPCDFPEFDECLALADLGASINLMPLSIWKKLSFLELTCTQMILELADRSTTRPAGIAEDVFAKVGKSHFLTDFVVVDYVVDLCVPVGTSSLPRNTIPNPREDFKAITTRSGVTLAGPMISLFSSSKEVDREPETITDQVLTGSTNNVPPLVVQPSPASTSFSTISSFQMPEVTKVTVQPSTENIQPLVAQTKIPIYEPVVAPKPKPTIPYPLTVNKQKLHEKDDNPALKFVKISRNLHFELSFTNALLHMPKFALMFKSLLNNKEKLFDLAINSVNENCSVVILKKLLEKLGDPDKFLIPYDFPEFDECLALADLGASINLMPLSIWKKLSFLELTCTQMILELADRSTTRPVGIAEDVFAKVGKSHFLTDFVVVDYVVDLCVPVGARS